MCGNILGFDYPGRTLAHCRPFMMPRRTMRSAVMTLTSMICAAAAKRDLTPLGSFAFAPRLGPAVARPVGLPPRLRVADVVAGCDQASARSAPGCMSCCRSTSLRGTGFLASIAAI
jgi:hypothetical protein